MIVACKTTTLDLHLKAVLYCQRAEDMVSVHNVATT